MPPSCTPEKKNECQNSQKPSDSNELYFTTKEFKIRISDLYEIKKKENNEIEQLMKIFPDVKKLFTLQKQVGHGTFSKVYLASLKENANKLFAIKHIVPTCHPERIKFELQCLKDIGGIDNVAGINLSLRNQNDVILIMPYQPHDFFHIYVGEMDVIETACYMKNLLRAIARVHSFGIVHRDIKPSNFLYDRKNKKFLLVDFGLAHTVSSNNKTNEKKRKRDAASPTTDIEQPLKKVASTSASTSLKAQSISQKENDPSNKEKVQDNFTNITTFQQNPNNKLKKKSPITLTKSPPIQIKNQNNQSVCKCYAKPQTCNICVTRKTLKALRAGTPGFRPPEVLLKSNEQDTAIDVWGAGIIMLSILSNCCNFFSSPDDMTALAEIITVFGSEEVKKVANQLGRYLISSENCPALDLRKICCTLRSRNTLASHLPNFDKCKNCKQSELCCLCIGKPLNTLIPDNFSSDAYDLLSKLLDVNVKTRISATDALNHPFLTNVN